MFVHNFKYTLKTLIRSKELIFWTFAFPLILATFFYMAFSNISKSEKLDIIDIAIINNNEFKGNGVYKNAFDKLSDKENKDRLFKITYTNEDKAKQLLEDDKIIGFLKLEDGNPRITINKNGIDQTVFKYATEEISQTSDMVKNLSEEEIKKELISGNINIDYNSIYQNVDEMIENSKTNLKDVSNKNLDYVMIEFYTLIAMTCLYGGILSMVTINQSLANMSSKGKRVSISPTNKKTIILSSVLASYLVQIAGLSLLFLYTIFVLKVNYGSNIPLIILLSLVGSLAGLSLGIFIAVVLKSNEKAKTGILIATTMLGCFFAGMFGITMKYITDKNIPFVNKINPVNMITDGFYSLYYYDTLNRYWINVISLLIFSFILILISFAGLRRQKYDSI